MVQETMLSFDPQTALLDVHGAAELAFGPATTKAVEKRHTDRIYQWVKRGHLAQCGVNDKGRAQFLGIDVLRAVQKTKSSNPTVPLEERQRWGLPVRRAA